MVIFSKVRYLQSECFTINVSPSANSTMHSSLGGSALALGVKTAVKFLDFGRKCGEFELRQKYI
jgi:hypothetical protein